MVKRHRGWGELGHPPERTYQALLMRKRMSVRERTPTLCLAPSVTTRRWTRVACSLRMALARVVDKLQAMYGNCVCMGAHKKRRNRVKGKIRWHNTPGCMG